MYTHIFNVITHPRVSTRKMAYPVDTTEWTKKKCTDLRPNMSDLSYNSQNYIMSQSSPLDKVSAVALPRDVMCSEGVLLQH